MKSLPVLVAWAIFAAMLGVIAVVVRPAPDRRSLQYMPDMAYSVPYNAFAPNPVTKDGKTLQRPPAGTLPRGVQPFGYAATPEDAVRAGRDLRNPIAPSAEALAHGQALYETFCLVCHGKEGRGDGPLVPRIPNPPAYSSSRVRQMPPGQIFHVISRGSGRMPSYAAQIPYDERWFVVLYVSALRDREGAGE